MKFFALYGWFAAIGGVAGIASMLTGVKLAHQARLAKRERERQLKIENARYGGRDPDENAMLLEETCGMLQEVQEMMDDPAVSTLLDVAEAASTADIIGTRQRVADQLAKLDRKNVKAFRLEQARRHDQRDRDESQTRQQGA